MAAEVKNLQPVWKFSENDILADVTDVNSCQNEFYAVEDCLYAIEDTKKRIEKLTADFDACKLFNLENPKEVDDQLLNEIQLAIRSNKDRLSEFERDLKLTGHVNIH